MSAYENPSDRSVAMSRPIYENVGRLDAGIRFFLVLAEAAILMAGLIFLHVDWALLVIIHGLVSIAYLALSAYVRIDPLYYAFDWSTTGRRASEKRQRVRRIRGRPM